VQEKCWEAHSFKLSRLVFCLNRTFQRAVWHFFSGTGKGRPALGPCSPTGPCHLEVYTQPRTAAVH
jgi:hypothetical protein